MRIAAEEMSKVLLEAKQQGHLVDSDTAVLFFDLSRFKSSLSSLKSAFPAASLHAMAIKANPLLSVLKTAVAEGIGLEAASIEEVHLALLAGAQENSIVLDSPCKTEEELRFVIDRGIRLNADNLTELARIDAISNSIFPKTPIGIRINPQIGRGAAAETSTADTYSQFGVPLGEAKEELIAAFRKYSCLNSLHVHVGSQGMSLGQLVEGVNRAYQLAAEINSLIPGNNSRPRICCLDIGGGLPVKYCDSDREISFAEYRRALEKAAPGLFSSDFELITEFGRSLNANCGWMASKIEYVKDYPSSKTLITHIGANMFMRRCNNAAFWQHDFSAAKSSGELRLSETRSPATIAGPLCFAGDVLGRDIELPESVSAGDYLLIHDAGAYTFALWSVFCSRPFPKVLGYENNGEEFTLLRQADAIEAIASYWS